jgi:hypothetical protein
LHIIRIPMDQISSGFGLTMHSNLMRSCAYSWPQSSIRL